MRTFTVVPSFDGDSAFFELPDIGFQGDNLSFAILFNLTELTEHWPDIVPSMIVTDPENNTFIAPHTSWNSVTHIFTWSISEVETAYKGNLRCQLKCTKADDPDTIVCMSRICQTRVYESLAASSDPPEAFQTWIDTLVALGAEVNADAAIVQENTEASRVNAATAQIAADEAEAYKNAAEEIYNQTTQAAQTALSAEQAAVAAKQGAQNSAAAAEAAKIAAEEAQASAEQALEETDTQAAAAAASARSAADSAEQAIVSMTNSRNAQTASEQARDAAIVAQGLAEAAQGKAEEAEESAHAANAAAEQAQAASEDYAETSKKWAIGLDRDDNPVASDDPTYDNNAKYHSEQSEASRIASEAARDSSQSSAESSKKWAIGIDANGDPVSSSDQTYNNNAKYWADQSSASADFANEAKDTIVNVSVSSASYSDDDESITVYLGGSNVIDNKDSEIIVDPVVAPTRMLMRKNTTEYWRINPQFVPRPDEIIVYTDYQVINGQNIPAIKMGDGQTPVISLPFMVGNDINAEILDELNSHVADDNSHVSEEDRARWNGKLNYHMEGECLVFTTD